MAKMKKFRVVRVPIEVEYVRPILGRVYALFVWLRCIKVFKFRICLSPYAKLHNMNIRLTKTYMLAVPKFERNVVSG
ncbi:MAG TPA: hypothetical protein PLF27_08150 [Sedimentibacter sp.]|nr:hypothetical protein [Sedimentibacter sp.]